LPSAALSCWRLFTPGAIPAGERAVHFILHSPFCAALCDHCQRACHFCVRLALRQLQFHNLLRNTVLVAVRTTFVRAAPLQCYAWRSLFFCYMLVRDRCGLVRLARRHLYYARFVCHLPLHARFLLAAKDVLVGVSQFFCSSFWGTFPYSYELYAVVCSANAAVLRGLCHRRRADAWSVFYLLFGTAEQTWFGGNVVYGCSKLDLGHAGSAAGCRHSCAGSRIALAVRSRQRLFAATTTKQRNARLQQRGHALAPCGWFLPACRRTRRRLAALLLPYQRS